MIIVNELFLNPHFLIKIFYKQYKLILYLYKYIINEILKNKGVYILKKYKLSSYKSIIITIIFVTVKNLNLLAIIT